MFLSDTPDFLSSLYFVIPCHLSVSNRKENSNREMDVKHCAALVACCQDTTIEISHQPDFVVCS